MARIGLAKCVSRTRPGGPGGNSIVGLSRLWYGRAGGFGRKPAWNLGFCVVGRGGPAGAMLIGRERFIAQGYF